MVFNIRITNWQAAVKCRGLHLKAPPLRQTRNVNILMVVNYCTKEPINSNFQLVFHQTDA